MDRARTHYFGTSMSSSWYLGKCWQVFDTYIKQGIGIDNNNHLIVAIVY